MRWTAKQIETVVENYGRMPTDELARKLGCTTLAVYRQVARLHDKVKKSERLKSESVYRIVEKPLETKSHDDEKWRCIVSRRGRVINIYSISNCERIAKIIERHGNECEYVIKYINEITKDI